MPRFRFSLTLCVLAVAGYTQPKPSTASELEAMERFAAQPFARVVWLEDAERITSRSTRAVISAVVLEDQGVQIRGVRIQLSDGEARDVVYTAAEHLDRAIAEMEEIATGLPDFFRDPGGRVRAPSRCFGSGIFLRARREGAHIFGASQCATADGWYGVVVSVRAPAIPAAGSPAFRFEGLDASRFAAALSKARELLANH